MEGLIKPSLDECLYKLNYHEFSNLIFGKKEFKDIDEAAEQIILNFKTNLQVFKPNLTPEKFAKLSDLYNNPKLLNGLKKFDILSLLTSDYKENLNALTEQLSFSDNQKHQLEQTIFNYSVSLRIENFIKKQSIPKDIVKSYKDSLALLKSFDTNMDNFLKTYDNMDLELKEIVKNNIEEFKLKMRKDIENKIAGESDHTIDEPISALINIMENDFFKTILKPGRRQNHSVNILILNLYKTSYDPLTSTYLSKINSIIKFLNNTTFAQIEGIELSENALRKKIKDLIKLDKEQDEITEYNAKVLLAQIAPPL